MSNITKINGNFITGSRVNPSNLSVSVAGRKRVYGKMQWVDPRTDGGTVFAYSDDESLTWTDTDYRLALVRARDEKAAVFYASEMAKNNGMGTKNFTVTATNVAGYFFAQFND